MSPIERSPAPASAPEGSRNRRKRLTRDSLIRAGRSLFGERGLYDSRIEDLTRVAGIAKGTLYTYFEDKDALILAVVESGLAELDAAMARDAGRGAELEPLARRLMASHLRFLAENPDLMRILLQVRGLLNFGQGSTRALRRLLQSHLAAVAAVLARNPRFAALSATERIAIARLAYGGVSGITSTYAALGIRRPAPRDAHDVPAALARMVVARVEFAEARRRRAGR